MAAEGQKNSQENRGVVVEAAGIEPASAWLVPPASTCVAPCWPPEGDLAAGLAPALAWPAASRVLSRPPPPDEDLDQPAVYDTAGAQQASAPEVLTSSGIS